MEIELSSITFTDQDDIVSGGYILNTGITNTLAGNDQIRGYSHYLDEDYWAIALGKGSTLNMGEGDDLITTSTQKAGGIFIANGSTLDTGNGNDRMNVNNIYNESFTFTTGDGNDTIEANGNWDALVNKGLINTGNGKDTIIATGATYFAYSSGIGLTNYFTIDTGEGDDIITAGGGLGEFFGERSNGIENYGTIDTGEGDDTITGYGSPDSSGTIINTGTIDTGNGNDIITASGKVFSSKNKGIFTNRGGVFLGEGNDSLTAGWEGHLENFNVLETGGGNDIITSYSIIYNESTINTGSGEDSIISTGLIYNEGVINMGDGNDSIIAYGGFESSSNSNGSLFLGEGEDYIKGFGSGDFYGGNGNDTLELTPGTYTFGIWGEEGEWPIFTKGDQLMITSEFEKLKAGNTLYDFTSLTAGQVITVA
jgi:hypothetical protein